MSQVYSVIAKPILSLYKQGKTFVKRKLHKRAMMGKDFKQSFEQFEALKRAENEVYAARERLRKVEKILRDLYEHLYWRRHLDTNPITREQAASIVGRLSIDDVLHGIQYEYERLFIILVNLRSQSFEYHPTQAAEREQSRVRRSLFPYHYRLRSQAPDEPVSPDTFNVQRQVRNVRALNNMHSFFVNYEREMEQQWRDLQANSNTDEESLPVYSR